MTEAQQLIDEGHKLRESEQGHPTLIYRGRHIVCHFGRRSRNKSSEFGGQREERNLTAVIRKSAHATRTADANEGWTADSDEPLSDEDLMPPHPGKRAMAFGRMYRVASVDETEVAWIVRLESPDR